MLLASQKSVVILLVNIIAMQKMVAEVKPEWKTTSATCGLATLKLIRVSLVGQGKRIWTRRAWASLVFGLIFNPKS